MTGAQVSTSILSRHIIVLFFCSCHSFYYVIPFTTSQVKGSKELYRERGSKNLREERGSNKVLSSRTFIKYTSNTSVFDYCKPSIICTSEP